MGRSRAASPACPLRPSRLCGAPPSQVRVSLGRPAEAVTMRSGGKRLSLRLRARYALCVKTLGRVNLAELDLGFYDPAERAREKGRQRREDARAVAEGRVSEVDRRNQLLSGARPVVAWETVPPLE